MAAMSVVEEYHKQLKEAIAMMTERTETPIREFVMDVKLSSRLRQALESLMEETGSRQLFLEEIDAFKFRQRRNCGCLEFFEKREQYLRKRLA